MLLGTLIYGFVNSAILALLAMGFNLTFGISGVAKVQTQLVRIADVTFATCFKSLAPQFAVSQLEVFVLLLKLFNDVVFGGELVVLLLQFQLLLSEHDFLLLEHFKQLVVRKCGWVSHAHKIMILVWLASPVLRLAQK